MSLKDTLQEVSVSLMRARCLMDDARTASMKPPGLADLDSLLEVASYCASKDCLVTYEAPAVITFPSRCKWSRRGRVYRWRAPLSYSFEATWVSVRATV